MGIQAGLRLGGQGRGRRNALIFMTALVVILFATMKMAEAQDPQPAGRRWSFAIPAQGLSDALLAFSRETGIQVIFRPDDVKGFETKGLEGEASAEEGLRRLIGGTGLSVDMISETSAVIVAADPDGEAEDGAEMLEKIKVEAIRDITSYLPTEGYVSYYSVAATKTDTPIIETPQAISTIGREEIEARDAKTIAEAVRYSAGVTVDAYGVDPRGYDSITIRGFYAATFGSFRDGLRMDSNSFSIYATEPYGVERVDIMRGPSGALYGQAEAGGVVDRTTKRPRADMLQEIRVEAGSWNHYSGAFDIGGRVTENETLLFRLTGLVRESETEFDYNDGKAQQNDRIFIAPAVTWAPSEDTRLTVLVDYLKDDRYLHPGPFANEEIGRSDVVPGEPDFDKFEQEQYAFGYNFVHSFNPTFTFRQRARYSHVEVDYQGVYATSLAADGQTLFRYTWAAPDETDQFAIDNQLETKLQLGPTFHTALVGFDYSRSKNDFAYYQDATAPPPLDLSDPQYTGAEFPPIVTDTELTLSQAGAYLQDQLIIDDRWIFTFGGRLSWVESDTDDRLAGTKDVKEDVAFTGRAGFTYLFDFGLAPYFSYIEGFLPTQGTDLSGDSFDPQESTQYEIGLKYEFPDANVLLTAAAFHLTKTNVLSRDPDNINVTVQTGEIRSRGVELEAKASLFSGLDLTAAYTFTDAKVTESIDEDKGKRPVTVPEHTAALWMHYQFDDGPLEGVGFGGGLRYVGETYNDLANTSVSDDYLLADATASYEVFEGATLAVNAKNLLDKEYVSTCAFGSCYYGPGRQITASLTFRW